MADVVPVLPRQLVRAGFNVLPLSIVCAGEEASWRFVEFFTARMRNPNTRMAYTRTVYQFFLWCEDAGVRLRDIKPPIVAAYIEYHQGSKPTVKQHLSAIRMLFDYLVTGGILPTNPASSVRGPTYVAKRGKNPC